MPNSLGPPPKGFNTSKRGRQISAKSTQQALYSTCYTCGFSSEESLKIFRSKGFANVIAKQSKNSVSQSIKTMLFMQFGSTIGPFHFLHFFFAPTNSICLKCMQFSHCSSNDTIASVHNSTVQCTSQAK